MGWILNFRVRNGTIKEKKMKKSDSGVKTQKGSLEWKRNLKRLMDGANKRMKGQQPRSIGSLHGFLNPFQNRRIWTFYPIMHFLNSRVYHGGSWRLSNCHIQGLEKWIFLRCLIFKKFLFLEKALNTCHPFNQTVKINLLSQIIRFPS